MFQVNGQRPLAPSNLRGGANLQWGKWLVLANVVNRD